MLTGGKKNKILNFAQTQKNSKWFTESDGIYVNIVQDKKKLKIIEKFIPFSNSL